MNPPCTFCEIAAERVHAHIVSEDDATMAFVDLRQVNPGHVLVIPRSHIPDIRRVDEELGSRLMQTVVRVTRAVDAAFPNKGLSIWHSVGPAAFQEVPHLHVHIHPRVHDDNLLKVYPGPPEDADPGALERIAEQVRDCILKGPR